jgi:hypothetical protein
MNAAGDDVAAHERGRLQLGPSQAKHQAAGLVLVGTPALAMEDSALAVLVEDHLDEDLSARPDSKLCESPMNSTPSPC